MITDPNIRANLERLIETMGGYAGNPPVGETKEALRQIVWALGGNALLIEQGPPEFAVIYTLVLVAARAV